MINWNPNKRYVQVRTLYYFWHAYTHIPVVSLPLLTYLSNENDTIWQIEKEIDEICVYYTLNVYYIFIYNIYFFSLRLTPERLQPDSSPVRKQLCHFPWPIILDTQRDWCGYQCNSSLDCHSIRKKIRIYPRASMYDSGRPVQSARFAASSRKRGSH